MTRIKLAKLGDDGKVGGPNGSPSSAVTASSVSAGLLPVATGADGVSWLQAGVLLPELFGAAGDGVTDDTSALKSWLASGKHVALTPGKTYLHRQSLSMTVANQVLDGQGATLKRAAQAVTTTTTTITSGVTNSITVAATSGGSGAGAWTLQVGDQIVVQQGAATNFDGSARTITNIVGNVVTIAGTFGISLSGTTNVYHGWNQLVPFAANQRVTNLTLDGNSANWSWGRWQHTVAFQGYANAPNTLMDHCRVINQYGDGLTTQASGTTFAFNDVENIKGRGYVFAGIVGNPTNFDTRIVYNRFINCNGDGLVAGGDGQGSINFSQGGPGSVIHGNYVDGGIHGLSALSSLNNGDATVTDNEFWNLTGLAIQGGGGSTQAASNVTIANNRCYGSGISITNGGSSNIGLRWNVHDNLIIGATILAAEGRSLRLSNNTIDATTLAAPGLVVATAVAGGGTFAAGTYFWTITAYNAAGETLGSTEVSATVALNGSVNLTWAIVPGATGYWINRATSSGGETTSPARVVQIASATTAAYTDTGTAVTTGAAPAANTTAINTLNLVELGGGPANVLVNTSVRGNALMGGSYGVLMHANCAGLRVEANMFSAQHNGGVQNGAAGSTDVAIKNNTVIPDATGSTSFIALNLQYSNGDDASGNLIDLSALGSGSSYGILVGASSTSVVAKHNRIARASGGSECIAVASGATNANITNNWLNIALSDAGTNTRKFANTYTQAGVLSGRATLVAGTVTVSTGEVVANDNIILSRVVAGGTLGQLSVGTIVAGASFVINSDNAADTSTVYWLIEH